MAPSCMGNMCPLGLMGLDLCPMAASPSLRRLCRHPTLRFSWGVHRPLEGTPACPCPCSHKFARPCAPAPCARADGKERKLT